MHAFPAMTRRSFCIAGSSAAASALLSRAAMAQPASGGTAIRPDVAAIDHDRILAAAVRSLEAKPAPLTLLPCPRSPGTPNDFYSEGLPDTDEAQSARQATTPLFTAHSDALLALGSQVPALAAAGLLTADPKYAKHAALHLRAWFVDPETSMTPSLNFGQVLAGKRIGRSQGILETLPLVEVAQAIPFLANALSEADLSAIHTWFAAYLTWLTAPQDSGPRLAALARDRKDRHATSWLLQASAYSLLTSTATNSPKSEDSSLTNLRHHFKTVTLRAQISAQGTFLHEITTANPYRNSLFNLDMLAAICDLLTTRFETLWPYELQDGPGMRAAIAFHVPFIADRGKWPYRADADHFKELPCRRASLLFAAKAFSRPEYAALWKTLPADSDVPDIERTMPVNQPLLWVRQPPRAPAE